MEDGSGTVALAKIGSGTLLLEKANTYSGGTTVTTGTLSYNSTDAFGTGTITFADGTTFTAKGGGSAEGRYRFNNEDIANDVVLTGGKLNIPLSFGGAKDIWLKGDVSGAGGFNITGTHRDLSLSGNNSFQGGVSLISSASGGTAGAGLVIASYNALGTGTLTVGYNLITHWRHGIYFGENLDGVTADPQGSINPNGIENPINIVSGKIFYIDCFDDDMTGLLSGVISGDGSLARTEETPRSSSRAITPTPAKRSLKRAR